MPCTGWPGTTRPATHTTWTWPEARTTCGSAAGSPGSSATYGLGGARSDGAWVGINGRPLGVLRSGVVDAWNWVKLPDPVILGAGTHTIDLRVQRRAFAVDRIMLSSRPDPSFSQLPPAYENELSQLPPAEWDF